MVLAVLELVDVLGFVVVVVLLVVPEDLFAGLSGLYAQGIPRESYAGVLGVVDAVLGVLVPGLTVPAPVDLPEVLGVVVAAPVPNSLAFILRYWLYSRW